MSFYISYKNEIGTNTIINGDTAEIFELDRIDKDVYEHVFIMREEYEHSHDGLFKYLHDFKQWCDEMINRKEGKIDYRNFYNDTSAVKLNFKNTLTGSAKKIYDSMPFIDIKELSWMNKCNNGGLIFLSEKGTYDCHGVDFKMFYPRILGSKTDSFSFRFPTKKGKQFKIKKLNFDEPLRFGYYHVMISSDHPDRLKLFSFSKKNVYTNYSLEFAHNQLIEFGFKIELIIDENYNAYLYDNDCIIESHKIFNLWYYKMSSMRKDFPKNRLLKFLTSSLSGHLTSYNVEAVNIKTIDPERDANLCWFTEDPDGMPKGCQEAIKNIVRFENSDNDYYEVINIKKPMEFNVGRFKAFLMSFGRNLTATASMIDLKNVVRIQTDGIVFKTKQDFTKYNDIPKDFIYDDDKTSGRIQFKSVNNYNKL
jgi:hypothetical protein